MVPFRARAPVPLPLPKEGEMGRRSVVRSLPFVVAVASVAIALSCKGRGSGTGQPYYGPGTGPIGSFVPGGGLGSLKTTEYLYWVNAVTNDIAIYAVDSQSGCLSPVTSNNISTGQRPISVQAHPNPNKRFLYVGCAGSGDILLYNVDPNGGGTLQPAATSQNVSNHGLFAQMRFRGDGTFLYVLTNTLVTNGQQQLSTGVLSTYAVDQTTGAINPPTAGAGQQIQDTIQVATPLPNLLATAVAIDQNNQFAYVTLSDNRIVTVALANNGSLSLVQQTSTGQNFINTAPSPSCILSYQNYIYEGSLVSSNLDFIQSAQGQLTLNQNTFPTGGQQPVGIYMPITGGFLFTANGQSGDISQFTLASSNGVLGPQPLPPPLAMSSWGAPVMQMKMINGVTLRALAINFTGKFLYSLMNGSPPTPLIPSEVTAFTIGANGLLTPATAPQPPPQGPAGPIGQPFDFFAVQKGGQNGEVQLLCPDSIIVNHTN